MKNGDSDGDNQAVSTTEAWGLLMKFLSTKDMKEPSETWYTTYDIDVCAYKHHQKIFYAYRSNKLL